MPKRVREQKDIQCKRPVIAKTRKEMDYFRTMQSQHLLRRKQRLAIMQIHESESTGFECKFCHKKIAEWIKDDVARSMDEGMKYKFHCKECEKTFYL